MAGEIIRLGDKTSHGGTVIEGSQADICMGKPIAYVGHKVQCPQCKGTFPIIEGVMTTTFYGKGVALAGMKTSCGAILIATQFTDTVQWSSNGGDKVASPSDKTKVGSTVERNGEAGTDATVGLTSSALSRLLEETTWIGFSLSDGTTPRAGEKYFLEDVNGMTHEGCLDSDGQARLEGIPRGRCKIAFPDIGQSMEMMQ